MLVFPTLLSDARDIFPKKEKLAVECHFKSNLKKCILCTNFQRIQTLIHDVLFFMRGVLGPGGGAQETPWNKLLSANVILFLCGMK